MGPAKHPGTHRTVPLTKSCLTQNVTCAEFGSPCLGSQQPGEPGRLACSHGPLLWKGCGTEVRDRWGKSAAPCHREQFAGPTGEIRPTGEGSELPTELGPRDGAFIYMTGVSKAVTRLVCPAPWPISHWAILGGRWAGSPPPLHLEGSLPLFWWPFPLSSLRWAVSSVSSVQRPRWDASSSTQSRPTQALFSGSFLNFPCSLHLPCVTQSLGDA